MPPRPPRPVTGLALPGPPTELLVAALTTPLTPAASVSEWTGGICTRLFTSSCMVAAVFLAVAISSGERMVMGGCVGAPTPVAVTTAASELVETLAAVCRCWSALTMGAFPATAEAEAEMPVGMIVGTDS